MNKINPADFPAAKKKMSKGKKAAVITIFVLVLAALIGLPVYWLTRPHAPDPTKLSQEGAIKYMASKQYAALPEAEKEDYMKKVRLMTGDDRRAMFRQNLTEAERRAMMQNNRTLMQKEMKDRMRKFFAMSKEEQQKHISEELARREKEGGRGGWGGPGGGQGGGQPGQGGPSAEARAAMMRNMLEGTDSTTRAQMAVYRQMMRAAQQQQATAKK